MLKNRPIPGSKDGHHWNNAPDDLYLIGAKLDKKNKKAYFKNYIPPMGFTTSNESFIRAARLNTIEFSLVTYTKDRYIRDSEGNIERIEVIEHVRGERNDAVSKNMGAMKQKTNLVGNGKGKDIKSEKSKEVYIMPDNDYLEILKSLQNGFDNRKLSKIDVAKDLGIEIVTDKHRNAIAKIEAIEKLTGSDSEKEIQKMINERDQVKSDNFDNLRNKLMADNFGEPGTKEKPNFKRIAAELIVTKEICTEDELKALIEKAKKNDIVSNFAKQEADETSELNDMTGIVQKTNVTNKEEYPTDYTDV